MVVLVVAVLNGVLKGEERLGDGEESRKGKEDKKIGGDECNNIPYVDKFYISICLWILIEIHTNTAHPHSIMLP